MDIVQLVEGGMPLERAVKARLASEGSSLAQWARERGLSRSSVSELLNGSERGWWWEARQALAEWAGTDIEWLANHLR